MTEPVQETPETMPGAPEAPAATPEVAAEPAEDSPEAKIATLEAKIAELSRENGKARVNAKQKAADEARAELAQSIGKAIGLITDETETPDPAQLVSELQTQRAETQAAKIELAVYRVAADAGANAAALLDSRSFMQSLADVDPADVAGVLEKVTAAINANPSLVATPSRRVPAPNPAQGSSSSMPPSAADAASAAERDGDFKTAGAIKAAQLLDLQPGNRPN